MISKLFNFGNHRRRQRGHCGRRQPTCRPVLECLEDRCLPSGIDPILEWNAVALQANAVAHTLPGGTQTGPTLSGRALAIVHVAMFDAFNSIAQRFTPYLTMVPDAQGSSVDAAVGQAAHDTLAALYPAQQADFDAALARTLDRVHGQPEARGIAVGRAVAQAILAARANDGSDSNVPYVPVPGPGVHDVDPYHPGQGFYGPGHGSITPFAITSSTQFPVAPPPALNSPAYAAAFNEVKDLGGDGKTTPTVRTPEQTQIGVWWGYDGSPGLGTPPRMYNQIARTLAVQMHNTEAENARLFALINVAMADAGISSWEAKYQYDFWRPVLGIQRADTDGNPATLPDADWKYYGAPRSNDPGGTNFTPNFPAYTSGHATFGAGMFRSLANFFGRDDIRFSFMSDEFNGRTLDQDGTVRPRLARTFSSFSQAAEENGQSRIYLGIHWSFDKTEGIKQGNAVADYVFANFFRPRHGSDSGPAASAALGGDGQGKTFFVNLSSPTNATIADGQGVGTIVDDEPRISISDVTKKEGRRGQTTLFTFTVTLSAAYDQAVTMSYSTVDGTAKASDNDYVAKAGTLTFAPGETAKTITIEVRGDSKREANETFYIDLFGLSSNALLTKSRGLGTILNDD